MHLQRAIRRVKEQADHHRRSGPAYTPGQSIWLSTRNLRLRLPCKKLNPRYVGPFKIIRQIAPVSYRLALPSNDRISPTFHVSLLKPAGCPREERDPLLGTSFHGLPFPIHPVPGTDYWHRCFPLASSYKLHPDSCLVLPLLTSLNIYLLPI